VLLAKLLRHLSAELIVSFFDVMLYLKKSCRNFCGGITTLSWKIVTEYDQLRNPNGDYLSLRRSKAQ
jgi:hypothetical protein